MAACRRHIAGGAAENYILIHRQRKSVTMGLMSVFETFKPMPVMHFLQQDHTYFNKVTPPNGTTLYWAYRSHFLSNPHTSCSLCNLKLCKAAGIGQLTQLHTPAWNLDARANLGLQLLLHSGQL